MPEHPRIYFLKEQKPLFMKLLKHLMPLFERKNSLKIDQLL